MNKIRIFALADGSKHEIYYGEGDPAEVIMEILKGPTVVRTNKAGIEAGPGRFLLNIKNVTRFEFKEDTGLE